MRSVMQTPEKRSSTTGRAIPLYNFSCGHQANIYLMTTTTRRACPICNKGEAVSVNKCCEVCGLLMTLPMKANRTKYCPDCRPRVARALSRVNYKNRATYIPASEIDVNEVLEGHDDPEVDPLDIVFAKYADDPFYRPPSVGTARPRGGNNGHFPPSRPPLSRGGNIGAQPRRKSCD
jgi:hypothetical protein